MKSMYSFEKKGGNEASSGFSDVPVIGERPLRTRVFSSIYPQFEFIKPVSGSLVLDYKQGFSLENEFDPIPGWDLRERVTVDEERRISRTPQYPHNRLNEKNSGL